MVVERRRECARLLVHVARAVTREARAVHVDIGGVGWRVVRGDRVAVEAGLAVTLCRIIPSLFPILRDGINLQ